MTVERTDSQIEALYSKASDLVLRNVNPWRGMTYIQGVEDTLRWLLGDEETDPLDELEVEAEE